MGNRQGVAANREPGKAVVTVRVRPLFLSDVSIRRLDLHVRSNEDRPRRVGYRPFQHRPINLRRGYQVKHQNRQEYQENALESHATPHGP